MKAAAENRKKTIIAGGAWHGRCAAFDLRVIPHFSAAPRHASAGPTIRPPVTAPAHNQPATAPRTLHEPPAPGKPAGPARQRPRRRRQKHGHGLHQPRPLA